MVSRTATKVRTEEIRGVVYWFDEEAADRAARFFPRFLTHSKGEQSNNRHHYKHYDSNANPFLESRTIRIWLC